jgi:hypothetical protein
VLQQISHLLHQSVVGSTRIFGAISYLYLTTDIYFIPGIGRVQHSWARKYVFAQKSYDLFVVFEQGKGLFALKPFKAGDVIFEEKPLVCCQFAWNAAYGYLACDFCMR